MIARRVSLLIAALFAVIVFLSKFFTPTPVDKMFVVVEASMLGLGASMIDRFGATYVGFIGGLLITMLRGTFAPFSLVFSLFYGLTTDISFQMLRVKESDRVRTLRAMLASTSSTAVTGISSMYTTVVLGLMPMMPVLYLIIILAGVLNGVIAGYLTSIIWNRYLIHHMKKQ